MAFLFRVDCSRSTQEPGAIATRPVKRPPRCARLEARAGSGDRAKRCLSEVKPSDRFFQTGWKCVETSGDVIKGSFTSIAECRVLDLSPMASDTMLWRIDHNRGGVPWRISVIACSLSMTSLLTKSY